MTKPEKPHYVYVSRQPDGGFNLVIMSKKQEIQELPLTPDLAFKFMIDFAKAANELHKQAITLLGNKEKQEDMFPDDGTKDGQNINRASV